MRTVIAATDRMSPYCNVVSFSVSRQQTLSPITLPFRRVGGEKNSGSKTISHVGNKIMKKETPNQAKYENRDILLMNAVTIRTT
jgi:hypothetical protein